MSKEINDGGPAFACAVPASHPEHPMWCQSGMKLRDWFAGMALSSLTAAPDYSSGPCNAAMAERAYMIADAMLKARSQ